MHASGGWLRGFRYGADGALGSMVGNDVGLRRLRDRTNVGRARCHDRRGRGGRSPGRFVARRPRWALAWRCHREGGRHVHGQSGGSVHIDHEAEHGASRVRGDCAAGATDDGRGATTVRGHDAGADRPADAAGTAMESSGAARPVTAGDPDAALGNRTPSAEPAGSVGDASTTADERPVGDCDPEDASCLPRQVIRESSPGWSSYSW
jgi:hypothetical protein